MIAVLVRKSFNFIGNRNLLTPAFPHQLAYITELVLLRALEVTEESFDNDIDIHVKAGQDVLFE